MTRHKKRMGAISGPPAPAVLAAFLDDLNRKIEAAAREGFTRNGRGLVLLILGKDRMIEPFVEFHTLDSPELLNVRDDERIVANVGSYDPATQLVVVTGRMHFGRNQLEDVGTAIRSYTATPASSPPVA